ncbi:MAG: hypothetical protein COB61_003735 [Thiotrichales bacterium]|nr:hypothetical protein [Thiotrichales bacterium]
MDRDEMLSAANRIGVEVFTLLFAYGINLVSLYSSVATMEGHWFSRSGSMLVMFGAFLKRKMLDRVVLFTLIYGTVVWGYGDLLFKNT